MANPSRPPGRARPLLAGFPASIRSTLLLIAAINTGIALVLWIDDTRPFWHPLLTVQLYGFSIAYCVNVAAPWDHETTAAPPALAAALIGALIGVVLVIVVKGYSPTYVRERAAFFLYNVFAAFGNGLLISLIFYVKRREARAATALHKAEAERHLLSKQAIEAELKLMQAQVEPHFLFNTLASVQYLTETDPKQANVLLGHLIAYLRAALPQLRARSSTLGQEIALAEAYLNILTMRIGPRLTFAIDVPDELRDHPFPPEPADLARRERDQARHRAVGGRRHGHARRGAGRRLRSSSPSPTPGAGSQPGSRTDGQGVGLTNIRERLAALYGSRGPLHARAGCTARHARDAVGAARSTGRDVLGVRSMPTALIAEDEPMLRAQLKARLAEAWPELDDGRRSRERRAGTGAGRRVQTRRRIPRHPDAARVGHRRRARARRTLPRRVRHRLRRIRRRGVRRRRRRLRAEAGDGASGSPRSRTRVKARLATPPLDLDGAADAARGARGRGGAAQVDPRIARQRHADDRRCRRRLLPGRGQVHEGRHA